MRLFSVEFETHKANHPQDTRPMLQFLKNSTTISRLFPLFRPIPVYDRRFNTNQFGVHDIPGAQQVNI